MVRTYPVASPHFDPARVAAWSAAIALHLLAFLLLLIPATYQAVQVPRDKTTVRLIEKIPPTPPPPVLQEPKEVARVVPKPQAQPATPPLPTPTATVEETQGIMLP
ncbi:energy transducer TonB, partial [Stenotrophomonas maltophilia]